MIEFLLLLWNSFPLHIRSVACIETFKFRLKTYFYTLGAVLVLLQFSLFMLSSHWLAVRYIFRNSGRHQGQKVSTEIFRELVFSDDCTLNNGFKQWARLTCTTVTLVTTTLASSSTKSAEKLLHQSAEVEPYTGPDIKIEINDQRRKVVYKSAYFGSTHQMSVSATFGSATFCREQKRASADKLDTNNFADTI